MTKERLMQKLLYLEDVTKRYGVKTVLNAIDLSVEQGEFCTLVGPSGCGKSTLLRLILGQERPTSGTMLLEEQPLGSPDARRGIVYQKYSLFPHLTVFGNVYLGLRLGLAFSERVRRRHELRDEVEAHLEHVKLAEHRDKYPHELSGGMQQRVAIAQALIVRPKVLLMDEPFGALDAGTREHMQVFLLQMWQEFGMTIFFVTHDLTEAVYLGTRTLVLSPYYSQYGLPGRGAKIVADYPSPWGRGTSATTVKASAEFGELVDKIRHEGFDPTYLQDVLAFNLKHQDSFPVEEGQD